MKRIILGSASPRRRELLEQIGIEFEILVSDKEERYTSTVPEEIVKELALMKAENVAQTALESIDIPTETLTDTVIIGADTIVVSRNQILGKPGDEAEAFAMLSDLQGSAHQVFTGVAVLDFDSCGRKKAISHAVETKVYVHEMNASEIRAYIQSGEPMDKAGAYGIQGSFAAFIDKIEGDYYNVVGLPVSYLYQQLKSLSEEEGEH